MLRKNEGITNLQDNKVWIEGLLLDLDEDLSLKSFHSIKKFKEIN